MIGKDYALRILGNTSERIRLSTYFNNKNTVCRNIGKVMEGIKNGFNKKD